jgi:hypothetical protein
LRILAISAFSAGLCRGRTFASHLRVGFMFRVPNAAQWKLVAQQVVTKSDFLSVNSGVRRGEPPHPPTERVTCDPLPSAGQRGRAAARLFSLRPYSVSVMSAYFTNKLTRPIPTTDGGTLRTVLDVQNYLLNLPEYRALLPRWQNVRQALEATMCANSVGRSSWP